MTATNGWPGKPGVPRDPEKDGWHWVHNNFDGLVIRFWGATFSEWDGYPLWMAQEWTYLGPCLTPDQATALQARVAELKRALREMIYATTHLSPQKADGSHWCKISKHTLEKARAALEGKKE